MQTVGTTQYAVRLATEVANVMTSVERVMAYTEIDSEPGYSTETRPSESWPNKGSLVIQDLSLVYFEGGPRILNDINVCVSSREKVGVVGRTGAGKSSLVSALFRMPAPLGKVRSRLLIIKHLFVCDSCQKRVQVILGVCRTLVMRVSSLPVLTYRKIYIKLFAHPKSTGGGWGWLISFNDISSGGIHLAYMYIISKRWETE